MELAKATPSENRSSARIVVSDIRFEAAQEVVTLLEKLGATAVAVECDVSNEEDVVRLAKKTKSTFGKLNLLLISQQIKITGKHCLVDRAVEPATGFDRICDHVRLVADIGFDVNNTILVIRRK